MAALPMGIVTAKIKGEICPGGTEDNVSLDYCSVGYGRATNSYCYREDKNGDLLDC